MDKPYRFASSFSIQERIGIIEEQLTTDLSNADLWEKHTGSREEHGTLNRWRKQLGYPPLYRRERFTFRKEFTPLMSRKKSTPSNSASEEDVASMHERIRLLEAQLKEAQLKAEGYELMIEIAEKELKIPIRKKSDTK